MLRVFQWNTRTPFRFRRHCISSRPPSVAPFFPMEGGAISKLELEKSYHSLIPHTYSRALPSEDLASTPPSFCCCESAYRLRALRLQHGRRLRRPGARPARATGGNVEHGLRERQQEEAGRRFGRVLRQVPSQPEREAPEDPRWPLCRCTRVCNPLGHAPQGVSADSKAA